MKATLKNEIIKRLVEADGKPISGQQLADEFGISRTAIWKHMKQLQEKGYDFETVKKRGYILTATPDTVDDAKITVALETEKFGHRIIYEESMTSTQTIAHNQAQDGASEGTIVICEEQTAGRGRMMREWKSTKGKGIWMSVIFRPEIPPYEAPQFTLVAAVALTKAIDDVTGVRPEIKWPNDLLIQGKKCTGILTELQADPDRVNAIIMGIGINVNHEQADFDEEIKDIATSLKIVSGKHIDRAALVARILYYLEIYSAQYVKEGFEPIKSEWESYSCTIGSRIRATTLQDVFIGKAIGITKDGVLELQLDDGTIKGIYSADITLEK
ncbi:biotin--[acetyl-CoA-carboxylase] ligase [Viridibacillus sp. YIM B01967]|uniref:Bifunctional ligase/repressor BirA n=1 Tax=Viridibacillus soli TaxID=2798301 RepID=A0ABS1HBC4_9BACL|nr:biotin--[acetyl-CoA-carboxylase] ligase [Viridibacillus soli]MBK3496745.1 biotin--[acetyl-CoA-carboxylase] ligase [Viridibacillus soli]